MPSRSTFSRFEQPRSATGWQYWLTIALAGAMLAATLALALSCFVLRASQGDALLIPSGIAGLAAATIQLRLTQRAWRKQQLAAHFAPLITLALWRRWVAVALVAYLAALAIGPVPSIGWAWATTVLLGFAVLQLPLATSPSVLEDWRRWSQEHRPRRMNWLVYASIALVVGAEVAMQVAGLVRTRSLEAAWVAAGNVQDRQANSDVDLDSLDALDLQMTELRDGRFRVALVGDELVLRGSAQRGCLARIQQALPGVQFVTLEAPHVWTKAASGTLLAELDGSRPDLVLAVVGACDEIVRQQPARSWFDWRQFALAELIARQQQNDISRSVASAESYEDFLRLLAPQLRACRTPVEPAIESRWQEMFASLDGVALACRERRLPLALVVVPGPLQVSPELLGSVARRGGCAVEQIDVDLPQRRLAGYAAKRELAVVDLLPYLRSARQQVFHPHAARFSEAGDRTAAAAIGGWMQSRYGGQLALAAQLSMDLAQSGQK